MDKNLKGEEFMMWFREYITEEKKAKKWRDSMQKRFKARRDSRKASNEYRQYSFDGYSSYLRRKNNYLKSTKLR